MLNYFQSVDTNFNYHEQYRRAPISSHNSNHMAFNFGNLEGMMWNLSEILFRFFIQLCLLHISFCVKCVVVHVFFVLIHWSSLHLLDIKLLLVLYIIIFFQIVVCIFSLFLWYFLMKKFLDFIVNVILCFVLNTLLL